MKTRLKIALTIAIPIALYVIPVFGACFVRWDLEYISIAKWDEIMRFFYIAFVFAITPQVWIVIGDE